MTYDFNGSNQYLTTSTVPTTSVPLTMCAWFNTDDVTNQTTILSIGNNGSNGYFRLAVLGTDVGDPFSAQKVPDGGGGVFPTVGTVNSGQWHHGAGVYASTTSVIPYLDGVAGTEATTSTADPTGDFFSVGVLRRSGLVQYFNGRIAEAAVWSAALTADEIAALAKGYSPRLIRPASLIFYNDLIRDLNRPYIGPTLTASGSPAVADHPRIIYPARARLGVPNAGGAAATEKAGTDSLLQMTAEASALLAVLGRSDSLLPMLSDAGGVSAAPGVADGIAILLTEGAALSALVAGADTLSPYVAEAVALLRAATVADTLAVILSDAGLAESLGAVETKSGSDTLSPMTAEAASLSAVLAAADSILVVLADLAALAATVQSSDSVLIGWSDLAVIVASLATADGLAPAASDSAALIQARAVADGLGVTLTELAAILADESAAPIRVLSSALAARRGGPGPRRTSPAMPRRPRS